MKINLGCGKFKRRGFVNVDSSKEVKPDVLADVTITPWKWAKESEADLIFSDNLFEHIEPYTLIRVIRECHRVLKPGGLLQVIVPVITLNSLDAVFSDPTHVNYFTIATFDYYDHRHIRWKNYGRSYGIPKFERVRQERHYKAGIVELKVIK